MCTFLYGYGRVQFEGFKVGQVLFAAVYLISPQAVHKVGKDLDIKEVEAGTIDKGGQAQGVYYKPDKDGVEVAEMGGYHNNGTFFGKLAQLLDLAYDVYFIAQGIAGAEKGSEFLNAGAVEQA